MDFIDVDNLTKKARLKISTLLPEYIQTRINRNFIEATFDTLFSEEDAEIVTGYIGEKPERSFNPQTDFYIPEKTLNRAAYQLAPVVRSGDKNVLYNDILNKLKSQGAMIKNQERLFRQDFYSFSPMIDLNMFINFNQYFWLEKGPKTTEFAADILNFNNVNNTINVDTSNISTGDIIVLVGLLPNGLLTQKEYTANVVSTDTITVEENGNTVEFDFISQVSAKIYLRTDLNFIQGKKNATIYGTILQNGMVIRSYNDVIPSNNDMRFIVEGVGDSITLVDFNVLLGYDSSPYDTQAYDYDELSYIDNPDNIDYITVQRASKDGNVWSMCNRWFHESLLNEQDISFAFRSTRPIIQFNRNIKLYNFGSNYIDSIDVIYDAGNIQSLMGQSSINIDGVELLDGMKVAVKDDIDPNRTNKIYEVVGQGLENISFNEIASLNEEDVIFVKNGNSYGGNNYYFKNGVLTQGQTREGPSQDILFDLYDSNGIALNDDLVYEGSSFYGSKLFSYKENNNSKMDTVLNKRVEINDKGEIVFENNIDSEKYSYIVDFTNTDIIGSYYFKINDEFRTHWHKNDITVNQGIIDEIIVSDENKRIYEISQRPAIKSTAQPINILVKLNGILLQNGIDYIISDENGLSTVNPDKYIRISDTIKLNNDDFIKITSYNSKTPEDEFTGFYEVPSLVGLTSNIDNTDITTIARNDVFDHFFSILERQENFKGDPIGINNSWNIKVNYGRGNKIVHNISSIGRFGILNNSEKTDIVESIKYAEKEYRRFINKFDINIDQVENDVNFDDTVPYRSWIDKIMENINLGKSPEFPFFNSKMADYDYIPPTPQFLGILPISKPMMYLDKSFLNPIYIIKRHDGSIKVARDQEFNSETFTLGNSINYQLSQAINFEWEVMVSINDIYIEPFADYIVENSQIILNHNYVGEMKVEYITNIKDKVTLSFEYDIFYSNIFRDIRKYRELLEYIPNAHIETDYSYDEFNSILEKSFNKWVSQRGFDPIINDTFDVNNKNTYNYSGLVTGDGDILCGSWRAIFLKYYGTFTPHITPWEILNFKEKPAWWDTTYGQAPYTSNNFSLWDDIKNGIIRSGPRSGEYEYLKKPNMRLPVDTSGNLKSIPYIFDTQNPNITLARKNWNFGDIGPVELEWRNSLHYSFALIKTLFLMKPNVVTEIFWEPENNKVLFNNQSFNYLVNDDTLKRIRPSQQEVHNTTKNGETVFKYGIQQYIVAYAASFGKDADYVKNITQNIAVNLGYPVGGFIDNKTMSFSADNFGLIPQENINVSLHKSSPINKVIASGIILSREENGFRILGYDEDNREIPYYEPVTTSESYPINVGGRQPQIFDWGQDVLYSVGTFVRVDNSIYRSMAQHRSGTIFENDLDNWARVATIPNIGGITVKKYSQFDNKLKKVKYDTIINDIQKLYNIFLGYQEYLQEQGVIFNYRDNDNCEDVKDFVQSALDMLIWINSKPDLGNVISLTPFANSFRFKPKQGTVDDISNFVTGNPTVVSGNGNGISIDDILVSREDEMTIAVNKQTTSEKMFKIELHIIEKEHLVIFDNITNFNDVIFEDITNIRQPRLKSIIYRSKGWNGKMVANGFIIENDTITSNIESSVDKFRSYYDSDKFLIGENLSEISKNLVGYQNKDYFTNLLFDQRDSFQFYLGQLQDKGTNSGVKKLLRNNFVRGVSNIDVNELWAIRTGRYGNLNEYSNIDFNIRQSDIRTNPQTVQFLDEGEDDPMNNIIELSPEDDRFIFIRKDFIGSEQFKTGIVENKLPTAGFLLISEASYLLPDYNDISKYFETSVLSEYQRIWVAENGNFDWEVLRITNSGETVSDFQTGEYTISDSTKFTTGQIIIIDIDGLRTLLKIAEIVDANTIKIEALDGSELEQVSFENPVAIFETEEVAFSTQSEYENYVPKKDWSNNDLVFIKDTKTVIDPYNNTVIRVLNDQVNIDNLANSRIYETRRNSTVVELDTYHPVQGHIPLETRRNLDFITAFDPAKYNSEDSVVKKEVWGKKQVSQIWWNINAVRYLDYDQTTNIYKTNNWGGIFPNTEIQICQWIRSSLPPSKWDDYLKTPEGSLNHGINSFPLDPTLFVISKEYNPRRGQFMNYYYFWITNDNIVKGNKSLSTKEMADMIKSPTKQGIRWISPIASDSVIISNIQDVITEITAVQINYVNNRLSTQHSEWFLFGEKTDNKEPPEYIFDKVRHSLVGYNRIIDTKQNLNDNGISDLLIEKFGSELNGKIDLKLPVPDPDIISTSKYGSLYRPRQSWFRDFIVAREAFIETVNILLSENNWVDSDTDWENVMYEEDPQPSSNNYDFIVSTLFDRNNLIGNTSLVNGKKVLVENDISIRGRWSLWTYNDGDFIMESRQGFRLNDYWLFVDYYADGFGPDTRTNKTYNTVVERNIDIENLNIGDIVKTLDDGNGKFVLNEVEFLNGIKTFKLIGKQDATFKFNLCICRCPFGDQSIQSLFNGFYKTLSNSNSRNRLLISMINEAYRQNNVVDWAFKTSLVDLIGLEEKLTQSAISVKNLEQNIYDYFNDFKPFHTKVLSTTESKRSHSDLAILTIDDEHEQEISIIVDRVSCNADMTLTEDKWTAAERIMSYGGIPEEEIAGCKFSGSEIDGKFFNFFSNVIGAGYDANSYDSTILGYDFGFNDIQTLYDVVINGKEFTDPSDPNTIIDGGNFYQPLLSENRPPERISLVAGDFMMFDVFTFPLNIDFSFGYDIQPYDAEVNLDGNLAGYDFVPLNSFDFILRPKMVQDLYITDGSKNTYGLSQIPQSNDAIFVYVNGILIEEYIVNWDDRRPKIILDQTPTEGIFIKILSYSIGGNSSVVNDKLYTNVTSDVFDMETIIEPVYKVISVVNGIEVQNEFAISGLTNTQVRVPSICAGATVYIVVYQGDEFTKITNEKFMICTPSIQPTISNPKGPSDLETFVYKNGKRLSPPYTRYYDPITPINEVYLDERTYSNFGIKVFIDGAETTQYTYNRFNKKISFNAPQENVEIFVLNDVNAEYHFEDDDLYIHTVAYADNAIETVPNNARLFIDLNQVKFTHPKGLPIPLDEGVGSFEIDDIFIQNNANVTVNNRNITIVSSDTIQDVVNKINAEFEFTLVKAFVIGNILRLKTNGTDIILTGQWSNIGLQNGEYKNAVSQMQEAANGEYRVSSLDGRVKIIARSGKILNITSTGSFDMVSAFGFTSFNTNEGATVNVVSSDTNESLGVRTTVYRGNITGQYPVTRNGFTEYSTKVSVIGFDQINFSDYELTTIDFGYDSHGYGKEYDYNDNPGIDFYIPHNENETIIVTTYSTPERDNKSSFRIIKTLNNTFECYNITEDKETVIMNDVYPTDKEIVVKSVQYLPVPKPETNTPAFISIEGEVFGYFEIDNSDPNLPILKNVIRGAKGSVFGYTNGTDNDGVKVIKSGSKVINISDVIIPAKDSRQITFINA